MLVRTMASTEGAHNSHAVDLIVAGGDVVTMNPAREVLVGGSIAIAGGRIAAVGSTRNEIKCLAQSLFASADDRGIAGNSAIPRRCRDVDRHGTPLD